MQRTLLLLSSLALFGCDALLDSQYDGEVLLHIEGTVSIPEGGISADAPRAAVLWISMAPLGLTLRADDAALETELGTFRLSVPRLPSDEEFPGTWTGIDYLPDEPDVHTLFAVVVAYDDVDGDAEPDLDFAGYQTLDWLGSPTEATPLLFGDDVVIGLAEEFLVAAVELPSGDDDLGSAVPSLPDYSLDGLSKLEPGVGPYRFEADAWQPTSSADDVVLRLF